MKLMHRNLARCHEKGKKSHQVCYGWPKRYNIMICGAVY